MLATLASHIPVSLGFTEGSDVGAMAVGGSLGIAVIAIIGGTVKSIVRTRAREQSRREIAAYIAEGSIQPDEGERLMKAGDDPKND